MYLCFFPILLQLMDKFAEENRLEQLNEQKRRRKMLEYKREVDRMLEERRIRRAEEMKLLMVQHKVDEEAERTR